jgi:integrase
VSVKKPPNSPYYHFAFEIRGHRFHGSTKATSKRAAEEVERDERERRRAEIDRQEAASTSLRLDDVAGRYMKEIGWHHAAAGNTAKLVQRLVEFFGADRLITDITGNEVAELVAWRRGQPVERGGKIGASLSPFTINDQTLQLKKIINRAKTWNVAFPHTIEWRKYLLAEPKERVRELMAGEGERLEEATRDDYAPIFAFAAGTGLRLNECLLKWSEVNWEAAEIRKRGKGGKWIVASIDQIVRDLLWPLRGHHPEAVFTYVAARAQAGREPGRGLVKGARYPITYQGLKTAWRRLRAKSGVQNFRFHDFRHNVGTKLLRETGNLKLVQRALNHSDLKTTARYAHVLDVDVAEAMRRFREQKRDAQPTTMPTTNPLEERKPLRKRG